MNVAYNQSPERQAEVKAALPNEPVSTKLTNLLDDLYSKQVEGVVVETVKAEIEIYRKFPKRGDMEVESFDPTFSGKCFMGQGFMANSSLSDSDLAQYRKAVGTLAHPTWGNCTILELWGATHFPEYQEMVTNVFKYGAGLIDEMPEISSPINVSKYYTEVHWKSQNGIQEQINAVKAQCFDVGLDREKFDDILKESDPDLYELWVKSE